MNAIDGIQASLPAAGGSALAAARPLQQAGQQFEALLISELLRMTHSGEESWLGSGEDSASSCAMGVAEESLAQVISSQGGFGLGSLVTKSLTAASHETPQ
jgi:Rod binding domain-containing protein